MKKALKSIFLTVAVFICASFLVSCSDVIGRDDVKAYVSDFLDAVAAEDYERAETLLHPDRPADLKTFFRNIEREEGIDFQSGIEVEKYTGVSSSYYDSTVDGSRYEITMRAIVENKDVQFTIELVKNENGHGIYNLNVDTRS